MNEVEYYRSQERPLDCPVCLDGLDIDGADCAVCGCVTCAQHGCVECQDLEKSRPILPDPLEGMAEALIEEERLICADLDAHPEHARDYSPWVVKKWRETRGTK